MTKINPEDLDCMESRFTELSLLEPGWLDGEGKAINPKAIQNARTIALVFLANYLPLPLIFPTIEGDISLEWRQSALFPDGLELIVQ